MPKLKPLKEDVIKCIELFFKLINKPVYLILDDLTYSYFQQSQYPLAFTYLGYGNDQVFLHGFLHKFQVDGLILRALYLPEWLQRKYAIKVGQFICVAKPNIKPLLEDMFV